MSKLRVQCFGVSLDGYGAGTDQDLQNPLGVRGPEIMEWFLATNVWKKMHGLGAGETGVDNRFAERSFENIGAWILGRNMFGPVRGPWPDDSWKGWWGDEPPYHVPVFVLTHYARAPISTGRIARCSSSISPARRYSRIVATPPPRRTSRSPAAFFA